MTPYRQPIRPGDEGSDVWAVKRAYRKMGVKGAGTIAKTKKAGEAFVAVTKAVQRQHGLKADGVYGPSTHKIVAPYLDAYGRLLYRNAKIRNRTPGQEPPLPRRWPTSVLLIDSGPSSARWGIQPALVPQVAAICEEFGLVVTDGYGGHPPHAFRSDHRVGLAVDLAGSLAAMQACNLWADALRGTVFRWVGGPAHDADGVEHGHSNHVHLSWYRSRPTSIFGTARFR